MMGNTQDPAQHCQTQTQDDAANLRGGKHQNSFSSLVLERNSEQHLPPNEQKKTLLQKLQGTSWDTKLVISCVIAVTVDPLFFYIPIINEKIKCLGVDKNVRTAALLLRAITDIAFIWNIIYQIKNVTGEVQARANSKNSNLKNKEGEWDRRIRFAREFTRKMPWHSIFIDILAVLPIPQVLMAVFFKMRSSKYLGRRKIIIVFLLLQYLPRIYRMHHSSKKLRQNKEVWIRGAFYFFLYILASHMLGGFWYFFSIQRETSCWHRACMMHSTSGCNFYCDQDISSRNMTFISSLDEFCPVDVPANATTPFDFGIFLDSLKSGNTGQSDFAKKFFYSFWWGLRNLSNFGTNLETSTHVLENCFAILISIVGLLLFLYLIGNVQTFISMETEKAEERRKKLISTEMDIQLWMDRYGLDKETKNEIKEIVKKKSEKIKDADVENIFSILPPQNRIILKRFLCMEILRKVPLSLKREAMEKKPADQENKDNIQEKSVDKHLTTVSTLNRTLRKQFLCMEILSKVLQSLQGVKAMEKKPAGQENKDNIQEKVLTSICDFLKPVIYQDGRYVYRIGEPLDRMLIITDGLIWTYNTTSIQRSTSWDSSTTQDKRQGTGSTCLGKGSIYGNELLSWASDSHTSLDNLPMLQANVKAHGKVEGFILMAKDLKVVVERYKLYWLFRDVNVEQYVACKTIQNAVRQRLQLPKRDQTTNALVVNIPAEDLTGASSKVP